MAAAFGGAIGRDPFRQVSVAPRRRGPYAWWAGLAYVVIGLGFAADNGAADNGAADNGAADNGNVWLRIAGWTFAAVAFGDLARHAWRRLRG